MVTLMVTKAPGFYNRFLYGSIIMYFTFSFIAWYNKTKYLRHDSCEKYLKKNRLPRINRSPPIGAKIETITPSYYSRKYGISHVISKVLRRFRKGLSPQSDRLIKIRVIKVFSTCACRHISPQRSQELSSRILIY